MYNLPAKIAARFDDRANPYMVKELRQAVNNRMMLIIMSIFLLWQPVSLLLGYSGSSHGHGSRIISLQITGLVIFSFFALPIYVGAVCANEKKYSADMFYTTPMDSISVIFGKVKAGLCLVLLAMSITLPCMFGMSLFRGVDIVNLAWIAVVLMIYSTTNISYGIFIGLIKHKPFLFAFFILCYLVFLMIEIGCFTGTVEFLMDGMPLGGILFMSLATGLIVGLVNFFLIGLASFVVGPTAAITK